MSRHEPHADNSAAMSPPASTQETEVPVRQRISCPRTGAETRSPLTTSSRLGRVGHCASSEPMAVQAPTAKQCGLRAGNMTGRSARFPAAASRTLPEAAARRSAAARPGCSPCWPSGITITSARDVSQVSASRTDSGCEGPSEEAVQATRSRADGTSPRIFAVPCPTRSAAEKDRVHIARTSRHVGRRST